MDTLCRNLSVFLWACVCMRCSSEKGDSRFVGKRQGCCSHRTDRESQVPLQILSDHHYRPSLLYVPSSSLCLPSLSRKWNQTKGSSFLVSYVPDKNVWLYTHTHGHTHTKLIFHVHWHPVKVALNCIKIVQRSSQIYMGIRESRSNYSRPVPLIE